jgi:hypothetical protein
MKKILALSLLLLSPVMPKRGRAEDFSKTDAEVCGKAAAFVKNLQDEGICSAKQLGSGGAFAGDELSVDKSDPEVCGKTAAFVKNLQDEGVCSAKQLGL